jgi:hypothetical protein
MVRMTDLRNLFTQLQTCKIRVRDYRESAAFDAAFSIKTADTFIAGIADTILSGKTIPIEHRAILEREFIRSRKMWVMEDGSPFDLSSFPELLNWATIIESVRNECLKH